MRHRNPPDRRCTYLVVIEQPGDLRELANYLSTLSLADCDVVVLDGSAQPKFEENRRVLRWVSRHVPVRPQHRSITGAIDPVRAALALASCEKVIVAGEQVRYDECALDTLCRLLDAHEVVEPQDYPDPLPWWSGIDAGRILIHRGLAPDPDHGLTFGFRRTAIRGLRTVDNPLVDPSESAVRRLALTGAEVFSASELFVRRVPPALDSWIRERPRQADDDFVMPVKSALFFALIPMAMLLMAFAGFRAMAGYAGAIAFASMAIAVRGRIGASTVFPLKTCLFAPLWVLERSVSVYWALLRKLRPAMVETPVPVHDGARNDKVASGS
jgi:hypothetical protein